jgi:hypothetical protein
VKRGDRVEVIAKANEYSGFHGEVLDIRPDGHLVVSVEVKSVMTWNVTFVATDVKLESKEA